MSNIEILTKGYADSVFASGPVVKEITSSDGSVSVFVDGPTVDLMVKSGGGSSFEFISEDPSRSTLNLGQGGDISNNARLIYIGSPGYTHELQTMGSSIRICGGGDTSDMWDTELDVDNNGVSIKTGYSGEYFQARPNRITIGGDVYGNITSVFVNGPTYFSKDIYDKDGNKITGGGGGGSLASTVWQALFGDQTAAAWSIGANALRDNLAALGLNSAYLDGKYYDKYSNWAAAELKMFPMTLLFNSPITLEQLEAADPGLVLMAATPMQTP